MIPPPPQKKRKKKLVRLRFGPFENILQYREDPEEICVSGPFLAWLLTIEMLNENRPLIHDNRGPSPTDKTWGFRLAI